MTLRLEEDGAELVAGVLGLPEVTALAALFRLEQRPGARLTIDDLRPIRRLLASDGTIGAVASRFSGAAMRPVRAILLDKTQATNWSLAWHQDRVIAVRERREVPGFTGWSNKRGLLHVQAPGELMAAMLTLRIHLDAVDENNAPLRILPGSHLLGRLSEAGIEQLAETMEQAICLADVGDLWIYRTPVVHASDPQRIAARRRVLQVDYAGFNLPGGLRWAYEELH